MNAHKHYPRTWTAIHDNGWETWVAQSEIGDYVVWTCAAGESAAVDSIESTLERGQDAALLALAKGTGHACSRACGPWRVAVHPIQD